MGAQGEREKARDDLGPGELSRPRPRTRAQGEGRLDGVNLSLFFLTAPKKKETRDNVLLFIMFEIL